MTWNDEFAGDLSKWTHQTGAGGWGNSELENYTNGTNSSIISDTAATDGKALRITLRGGPGAYTSSRLNSNAYFTRGQLEFRAKHTTAPGFWPALWMLGQNLRTGTVWPACGEIDVMEQRNTENINYGTMHWADQNNAYAYYGGSTGATVTSYQTYSILWTDQFIRWFVNGVQYWEGNIAGSGNGTDVLDKWFAEANGSGVLDAAMLTDQMTYLPNDLLVKVDIASMAHGLECRAPMLDYRLVEFAAALPIRLKYRRGRGKRLLEEAFGHLLPREVFTRRKMGFGVPLDTWFRKELKPVASDLLLSPTAQCLEYFRPEAIRALWDAHQSGQADHSNRLWALVMFEAWLREWANTTKSAFPALVSARAAE